MKSKQAYLSLSHLAHHYDLHYETLRRLLKDVDLKLDEHFIIIGKSVRYHVDKIHPLITSHDQDDLADEVLERLMVNG
jgi:hypothetical protein